MALLYRLITLPKGSLKIANLANSPTSGTVNYGTDLVVDVSTENGEDSQGLNISFYMKNQGITLSNYPENKKQPQNFTNIPIYN